MTEYRAHFDAEITFVNGGALRAEAFRLDLPSAELTADEIGDLLVRHLGLALVGSVALSNLEIVEELHRGSRGVIDATDAMTGASVAPGARGELVDLSQPIRAGLVTYPGIPAPTITPHLTREASREHYAPGTEFAIDVITMAGNTGTYLDSPYHRYADGGDLASLDLATLVGVPARGVPADGCREPRHSRRGVPRPRARGHRRAAAHRMEPPLRHARVRARLAVPHRGGRAAPRRRRRRHRRHRRAEHRRHRVGRRASGALHPARGRRARGRAPHRGSSGCPVRGARFTAVPPRVEGFGTFPVRAFAELPVR